MSKNTILLLYYTFNYAVSKAISLSLFKKYRDDPEEFNKNYIEYLSAGTTLFPKEKLEKRLRMKSQDKFFSHITNIYRRHGSYHPMASLNRCFDNCQERRHSHCK